MYDQIGYRFVICLRTKSFSNRQHFKGDNLEYMNNFCNSNTRLYVNWYRQMIIVVSLRAKGNSFSSWCIWIRRLNLCIDGFYLCLKFSLPRYPFLDLHPLPDKLKTANELNNISIFDSFLKVFTQTIERWWNEAFNYPIHAKIKRFVRRLQEINYS